MRIKLYGLLREAAGASAVSLPAKPGATVSDVLTDLARRYPALRDRLFLWDGSLQPYLLIAVSGIDIRDRGGLAHPVRPQDEIAVFPPSAGG